MISQAGISSGHFIKRENRALVGVASFIPCRLIPMGGDVPPFVHLIFSLTYEPNTKYEKVPIHWTVIRVHQGGQMKSTPFPRSAFSQKGTPRLERGRRVVV